MSLVASSSLRKMALLLLGCAAAVTLGVWMVQSPMEDRWLESMIGGWGSIAFFGVCGIALIVQFVRTRPTLTIDSAGVTWTQRSDQTIPWSAISDIDILTVARGSRVLVLWLEEPERYPPSRTPRKPGPSLSTKLYGGDVHIPLQMLNTSWKNVLNAVAQYGPARLQ